MAQPSKSVPQDFHHEGLQRKKIDAKRVLELVERQIDEQGSLELRSGRSVFYGAPATGKTCTIRRLTGEIENLGQLPTLPSSGIEKPCTISLYHKHKLHHGTEEWKEEDIAAQFQTLLNCITCKLISQGGSSQDIQLSTEENVQQKYQVEAVKRHVRKNGFLERFVKDVTAKPWRTIREGLKAIEDITILHITDTGGQPEFYDILPLLYQGPAIFLLFNDLNQPLDEHCTIRYRTGEGNSSVEYKSRFTPKEMLFQLLVSVASPSADELNAAVMFIGTYMDLAHEESLQCREKELKEMIESTELFKKDAVKSFTRHGNKSLIFPLNNIGGSSEEIAELRASIAQVVEQAFDPQPIPTSWLLFLLVLRSLYEEKPGYCTVEVCIQVAGSCRIPANIVVDILKFMHKRFGTILYYDQVKSLSSLVICNPNIIFKLIAELIALSFGANPKCLRASEQIRLLGEINLPQMEEMKKESSPLSLSCFVDLLTHYNIISEIKKIDGSHVYFMPCLLLPDPQVGKEKKQALRNMNPAPLLIFFSTGYIPLGLFSALIVYLSKLDSWVIDPEKPRHRNKVHFEVNGSADVVLISHVDCLELHVTPASQCPYLVSEVREAVEHLKSRHEYMSFSNSLGFYCSSDLQVESGTPHHAKCWETAKPEACWNQVLPACQHMKCSPRICASIDSELGPKHKVWFVQKVEGSVHPSPVLHVEESFVPGTGKQGKPASPMGLSIAEPASSDSVKITWSAYTFPEPSPADSLVVELSNDKGATYKEVMVIDNIAMTEALVSGLIPNTTYKLRLAAVNQGGKSDPSNEIDFQTPVGDVGKLWMHLGIVVLLLAIGCGIWFVPLHLSTLPSKMKSVQGGVGCDETVLDIWGNEKQTVSWEGCGFNVTVPAGAVAKDVTDHVQLIVKANLSSQFELPFDSHLVSATYWISASHVFQKDVFVHLYHWANITSEEEASNYKLIVRKWSQETLSYRFKILNGVFRAYSQIATFSMRNFSAVQVQREGEGKLVYEYHCYLIKTGPLQWKAIFLFTPQYPPELGQFKEYSGKQINYWRGGFTFNGNSLPIGSEQRENNETAIKGKTVTVVIDDSREGQAKSWEIVSPNNTKILQDDVDELNRNPSNTTIPRCEISIKWTGETEQLKHTKFSRRVDLQGSDGPNFFFINFSPSADATSNDLEEPITYGEWSIPAYVFNRCMDNWEYILNSCMEKSTFMCIIAVLLPLIPCSLIFLVIIYYIKRTVKI